MKRPDGGMPPLTTYEDLRTPYINETCSNSNDVSNHITFTSRIDHHTGSDRQGDASFNPHYFVWQLVPFY